MTHKAGLCSTLFRRTVTPDRPFRTSDTTFGESNPECAHNSTPSQYGGMMLIFREHYSTITNFSYLCDGKFYF